jgi:hypothetical protein
MHKVNLNQDIVMFNNFISKDQCNSLLKITDISSQSDWDFYKESINDSKNEWDDRILDFKKIKKFNEFNIIFNNIFLKVQSTLNECYEANFNYTDMSAIYRTRPEEKMNVHYDQGGDQKIKYGAVLYLNDNYDGGQIYYPNVGIEIKPSAGSLVVHPSNKKYSHGVKAVKNGIRYCTTTFLF